MRHATPVPTNERHACTRPDGDAPATVTHRASSGLRTLTVDEVGVVLGGLTGSAVREAIRSGRLGGFFKVGRRLLVTEQRLADELRKLAREHESPGAARRLRATARRARREARDA